MNLKDIVRLNTVTDQVVAEIEDLNEATEGTAEDISTIRASTTAAAADTAVIKTKSTLMEAALEIVKTILTGFKEGLTHAIRAINTDHAYIHEGIAFKAEITLTPFAAAEYLITTTDTALHFKNLRITALGGSIQATIMRGTAANPLTIATPGSAPGAELLGPHNLNDYSENITDVTITKGPTYTDGKVGEAWDRILVVGDTTNQFTSVAETKNSENEELVMKEQNVYVLKLEKVGLDTASTMLLGLFWYEEADGIIS